MCVLFRTRGALFVMVRRHMVANVVDGVVHVLDAKLPQRASRESHLEYVEVCREHAPHRRKQLATLTAMRMTLRRVSQLEEATWSHTLRHEATTRVQTGTANVVRLDLDYMRQSLANL